MFEDKTGLAIALLTVRAGGKWLFGVFGYFEQTGGFGEVLCGGESRVVEQ